MINLNEQDQQTLMALSRLREPIFAAALKLIETEADLAKTRLVSATDTVQIHRLQGRAEAFGDLLQAIAESSKVAP